MKLILKGINSALNTDERRWHIDLLNQISFPIEVNAEDKYPFTVNLKAYISDISDPDSAEEWGIIWFDYE